MEFLKGVICLGIFMASADNTLQDLQNTSDATKTVTESNDCFIFCSN